MTSRILLALAVTSLSAGAVSDTSLSVTPWKIDGVSSPMWESHPAIDPRTGDLWFVRSDIRFSGWRLYVARCAKGRWTAAVPAPIAAPGLEADPWFSPDGNTLWFISTRATHSHASRDMDIWRAQRAGKTGWSAPEHLPAPVNSDAAEWFPRPASDGWLYFGSGRPGGLGGEDIWRARQAPSGEWVVENAGAGLNGAGSDYEFLPAPSGEWAILAADDGLFRAVRTADGWQRTGKFSAEINANHTEIGAMMAPDESGFAFSRDAGAGASGELFVAHLTPARDWPPHCGGSAESKRAHRGGR
ncbi:hypothetical protein [Sphingopyxis panaciterrae]